MNSMFEKSMPTLGKYAPFVILILLACTLLYNVYYFVKNCRKLKG